MPHLVCTPYTSEEEQPDTFEVTIDEDEMIESPAQTVGYTVRLYYDLSPYSVGVEHTYSIVAVQGILDSAPATGGFTLDPWWNPRIPIGNIRVLPNTRMLHPMR